MVMRPPMPAMQLSRRAKIVLGVVAALVVLLIVALSLINVYTDWLWFGEVGFRPVFSKILRTRLILFLLFGLLMGAVLVGNVMLAYRVRPPFRPMSPEQQNLERYRIALEPRKKLALIALGVVSVLAAGSSAQRNWQAWLLYFNGGKFGVRDPQFNKDISFFMWDYPVYRIVLAFLFAAVIFSILLSAAVYYLFGALRLQTPGPKITIAARRHLTVLVFFFIVFKAIAYWLDRYGLVFSERGKVTGASYTDVNAALPARTILFGIALVIAVGVLASLWLNSARIPAISFVALIITSIVISGIYPALVQQISVKPNASVKEQKYISRNIQATRTAYDIATSTSGGTGTVTYEPYPAASTAAPSVLTTPSNSATVDNIRLLDPALVSPTFNAIQQVRSVYGFPSKLDVDHYTVGGKTSQYVVGVRELKANNLSATGTSNQTTWINQHTEFTHGYGLVADNANSAFNDPTPSFSSGNIPQTGFLKNQLKQPAVYFGELGVDYSIVGAKGIPREFNGSEQTRSTYDGKGGVKLSNSLTRAAFALKYGQVNFLLNNTVSASGAKIIFNRDPRQRVLKVAPYLKVDGDPYPVVADGKIVWMLDCYTTAANYPYSEKHQLADLTSNSLTDAKQTAKQPDATFNYIRNSVKATVDAYDGTVHLYQWDDNDPVLKAWMKVFPHSVEPNEAMPRAVRDHVRYPQDLFEVQRALLANYHVTDPVQFYNASDQWTVPTDPYPVGSEATAQAAEQPPYYILSAPPTGGSKPEYQLTSPMKVNSREYLSAFISVNSEPGPNYGKITVLNLPTSATVPGPTQIANTFKTEATISKDLSLFNGTNGGSSVIHGNLLTLPVEESFLYVEPLYIVATGNAAYPLLQRVIVSFKSKVGYGLTLPDALANLSQSVVGQGLNTVGGTTTSPTTPPNTTPPPGSASSTTAVPPPIITTPVVPPTGALGTGSPALDVIVGKLAAAGARLSAAYKSGKPAEIGAAEADLKTYSDQYLAARKALLAKTPTPRPTPTATR